MSEERHSAVLALITEKGPLGVTAISKTLNIPLNTMQKWLHNQSYFRMNENRKWDLPENVHSANKTNNLTLLVNAVKTQLLLVKAEKENLDIAVQMAQDAVNNLERTASTLNTQPVANQTSVTYPERLTKFPAMLDNLMKVIKARKGFMSEEVYNLLINLRWVDLILDNGTIYLDSVFEPALHEVLLAERETFDTDLLETVMEYQPKSEE